MLRESLLFLDTPQLMYLRWYLHWLAFPTRQTMIFFNGTQEGNIEVWKAIMPVANTEREICFTGHKLQSDSRVTVTNSPVTGHISTIHQIHTRNYILITTETMKANVRNSSVSYQEVNWSVSYLKHNYRSYRRHRMCVYMILRVTDICCAVLALPSHLTTTVRTAE